MHRCTLISGILVAFLVELTSCFTYESVTVEILQDITPESSDSVSIPQVLAVPGHSLAYFTYFRSGFDGRVFSTDGTTVRDISGNMRPLLLGLTPENGLWFVGHDDTHGDELRQSTPDGQVSLVRDICVGFCSSWMSGSVTIEGDLYFLWRDSSLLAPPTDFYRTNGTWTQLLRRQVNFLYLYPGPNDRTLLLETNTSIWSYDIGTDAYQLLITKREPEFWYRAAYPDESHVLLNKGSWTGEIEDSVIRVSLDGQNETVARGVRAIQTWQDDDGQLWIVDTHGDLWTIMGPTAQWVSNVIPDPNFRGFAFPLANGDVAAAGFGSSNRVVHWYSAATNRTTLRVELPTNSSIRDGRVLPDGKTILLWAIEEQVNSTNVMCIFMMDNETEREIFRRADLTDRFTAGSTALIGNHTILFPHDEELYGNEPWVVRLAPASSASPDESSSATSLTPGCWASFVLWHGVIGLFATSALY